MLNSLEGFKSEAFGARQPLLAISATIAIIAATESGIPKGLNLSAQGCGAAATLGSRIGKPSDNPERVASGDTPDATPLGLMESFGTGLPRVGRWRDRAPRSPWSWAE
jgi:hypothetical protein